MKRLLSLAGLLALAGLQAACRDRSADADRLTQQARSITELEAKLDRIHDEMRTPLRETAKEVAESKQMADETEAYVSEKEKELLSLQNELETATREAENYRRKFVVEPSRLRDRP